MPSGIEQIQDKNRNILNVIQHLYPASGQLHLIGRVKKLCVITALGVLADCLMQYSRGHATFWAFLDVLFFAMHQLPGQYMNSQNQLQWNLVIKRSDITKPSYNKVILVVPALYISLF